MGKNKIIRVRLHRYKNRPIGLIWQYGQRSGEVSSGTTDSREAERSSGRLEAELRRGLLPGQKDEAVISWGEFRKRYEDEWLAEMSPGSRNGWAVSAGHFETICRPKFLADVSKSMLSHFCYVLESRKLSHMTVRSYYQTIHAGLGWAETVDLMDVAPVIRRRKTGKTSATMRNRDITQREFLSMLVVTKEVRPNDFKSFRRFMRGLWLTTMRIDELARLRWDVSTALHLDFSGRIPMVVFLGAQKNGNDTYLPAPPKFWQLINQIGRRKSGYVFHIATKYGDQMTSNNIGRQISATGEAAGVLINESARKFASAHDLRAAGITRIAATASAAHTQALARHADPKTTSQFYIRNDAEQLADALGW